MEQDYRQAMMKLSAPAGFADMNKGDFDAVFQGTRPGFNQPVAIARLDTDWYESAKIELEVLWPCVVPGEILLMGDYVHYQGQRKVCDDYFAEKPIKLTRIDYGCGVAQKAK